MRLYIVRHAIAAPHGSPGVSEDDRPLTPEGFKKMEEAAAGLKRLGVNPDIVLSSPLPRARQTAEIVLKVLKSKSPLETIPSLEPGGKRSDVYKVIRAHKEAEAITLVGHQPSLGEIAGEIAWGSAGCYIELKKGGACAIEIEDLSPLPRGTLLWLLTPSILRELE
jgi:phosphohistidine phosphatase